MDDEELLRLLTGERNRPIRVGTVSSRVQTALNALTRVVYLSPETVRKQEFKRVAENQNLYFRIPKILESPYILVEPPNVAIFIMHERTDKIRSFKAVVKRTKKADELFLVSLHRVDRSDVRRVYRRAWRLDTFLTDK